MYQSKLRTLFVLVPCVCLVACYWGKKVIARYPNGQVKAERRYKLHDSLNEIYIQFYPNGQMSYADYWHNRHATWAMDKEFEWYENGKKEGKMYIKYKDTALVFNASDSTFTFKGFRKEISVSYCPNGKIRGRRYVKNNKEYNEFWNETGDTLISKLVKNARPDGYDTINEKILIKNK